MVKKLYFIFCFFIILFVIKPVLADYEYNVTYNSSTMVAVMPEENIELFPRGYYGIRPIRDTAFPEKKVTLRFFSMGNVTGCAKLSDFVVKSDTKKEEMKVTPTDSELSLKGEKHRYSNHDCKIENNESYFDVPIFINELQANKINKIVVKSQKYGNFIDLNVKIMSSRLEFSSNIGDIPGAPKITVKMTYWLYPKGTVILSAPTAKTGQNVIAQIKAFAEKKGYLPLEQIVPDFRLSANEMDHYFFYDQSGDIAKQIKTPGESIIVGEIQTTRTIYGPNGPVEEPYNIPVHATTPGPDQ